MGRKEHSFLSILLKSQIFIPPKIGRIGSFNEGNGKPIPLFGSLIGREWNE